MKRFVLFFALLLGACGGQSESSPNLDPETTGTIPTVTDTVLKCVDPDTGVTEACPDHVQELAKQVRTRKRIPSEIEKEYVASLEDEQESFGGLLPQPGQSLQAVTAVTKSCPNQQVTSFASGSNNTCCYGQANCRTSIKIHRNSTALYTRDMECRNLFGNHGCIHRETPGSVHPRLSLDLVSFSNSKSQACMCFALRGTPNATTGGNECTLSPYWAPGQSTWFDPAIFGPTVHWQIQAETFACGRPNKGWRAWLHRAYLADGSTCGFETFYMTPDSCDSMGIPNVVPQVRPTLMY